MRSRAKRHAGITRFRTSGLSISAIAAEVGCSVGTVHRVIKKAEV
ncbi:MAG: helix-turn-helix domain-containing protein [Propionibacteriaceae bacterium]